MGMDPLTLGLAATAGSSLIGAYGQHQANNAAQARFQQMQNQLGGMMKGGADPYAMQLDQLVRGQGPAATYDPTKSAVNTGSVMSNFNTGQDALMQFLRSDPSKQMAFDTSPAFQQLQAMDSRTQGNAVNALNANMGAGGLGARFGSSAAHQTSDLLANMGAQFGARNAGIMQQSFENQQGRALQGMGLQLQGAQGLASQGNAMAQLAAQLGIANQGNQQFGATFDQNARQQLFGNMMNGIQAGYGIQHGNDQYNAGLMGMMMGQQMPGGNGWSAVGGGLGDIGQMMMMLPMLRQLGGSGGAAGGGAPQNPAYTLPPGYVPGMHY